MDAREKFELRRKKILDNAEARLMRITGKIDKLNKIPTEPPEWTKSHCCPDSGVLSQSAESGTGCCHLRTTHLGSSDVDECTKKISPSGNTNGTASPLHTLPTSVSNSTSAPTVVENGFISNSSNVGISEPLQIKSTCWYDWAAIILLALLTRMLLGLGYGWVVADNVLTPFLVVVIPRMVYLKAISSNGSGGGLDSSSSGYSILYAMLVLARLQPRIAMLAVTVLAAVRHLFCFLAVYLFTFVMTHLSIESYLQT
ncbi:hypothetical protein AAG570_002320 [Ranatra chinensis]|uniref:Uncharacterized protein n=1 Tax=Ranatra chinensis TaxID=642074 RepID=A0ABD0YTW0_9HEMI